jgi:positive regulator of sigma E activity
MTVKGKAAQAVTVEPSERLILFVKFMIAALFCLVALQISVLFVLHVWSSEVFAAITGIIGTVTGILIYNNA